MQILKEPVINWHERRLINKMHVDQSVKAQVDKGETRSAKIGKELTRMLSPILFKVYSECLTNKAPEGFGDLNIKEQVIHTVKYAQDLALLDWLQKKWSCGA
jgi:hypothetical protein